MIEYTVQVDENATRWYLNGKLHREDGPAYVGASGTKQWYLNGELHREDGPAVEDASGTKEWWVNGKRHREDGPAIERANGSKAWWINGEELSEDEFNARTTTKELTVAQIEKLLGHTVKVVK